MNKHPYDVLDLPDQGCLIFTPCPGTKGIDLETSVSELHQAGADAMVTMMTDEKLAKLEVQATALVKGLRPNSLKLSAHTEYLAKHYDTKS